MYTLGDKDLRRKGEFRPQIKTILIISEGRETEPNYFRKFKCRNKGVQIKTPRNSRTDPISLIRFAEKKGKEYSIKYENGDRIYCIYDVNGNSDEQLEKAEEIASRKGMNVCLSNPCFELWFLLHYTYYNSFCCCSDLLNKLKTYIPNYEKNMKNMYAVLEEKQCDALDRAKRLAEYHAKSGNRSSIRKTNPLTSVHEVVDYINGINEIPS